VGFSHISHESLGFILLFSIFRLTIEVFPPRNRISMTATVDPAAALEAEVNALKTSIFLNFKVN